MFVFMLNVTHVFREYIKFFQRRSMNNLKKTYNSSQILARTIVIFIISIERDLHKINFYSLMNLFKSNMLDQLS